MPEFTIFLDSFPWVAAYTLITLGAFFVIFGRKHFVWVSKLFMAFTWLVVIITLLSIGGRIESKLEEGKVGGITFAICVAGIAATVFGYFLGSALPQKFSIVYICLFDGLLISLMVYTFMMTWTGYWFILLINAIIMTGVCLFLSLKYFEQMKI